MSFTWGNVKTLVTYNMGKVNDGVVDPSVAVLLPLWAKLFQEKIIQDRNYWFLKQRATLGIDATKQGWPLPSNFTEGMLLYLIFSTPNANTELKPLSSLQEAIRMFPPTASASDKAQPSHYLVGNKQFDLYPWPDQAYTLGAEYWGDMTVPDDTDNEFTNYLITHFPEYYVNYLTHLGFAYLQERTHSRDWLDKSMLELGNLRARHVARVMGSDFVMRPRTDVYGTAFNNRGGSWLTFMWGG